jgi:hypothetical protein
MIGSLLLRLKGASPQSRIDVKEREFRQAVRLGDEARDARNWALALEHYSTAVTLNPDVAEIQIQLGHSLKELGNFGAAETAYLRALELAPDDADLLVQLGHLYKTRGDAASAIRYYHSAVAHGSRDIHASSYLATPKYVEVAQANERGYPVFDFQLTSISRAQIEGNGYVFSVGIELDRIVKEELFYLIENRALRFGCQVYSGASDTDVIADKRGHVIDNKTSPSSLTVLFTLPATIFSDESVRLVSINGVYDGRFLFSDRGRPPTFAAIGVSKPERPDLFRYYLEKFNTDRKSG